MRSEIGGQKAKSQIPDLFPDMEFPNLFHLKEHKILMNLKKNYTSTYSGSREINKTLFFEDFRFLRFWAPTDQLWEAIAQRALLVKV